MPSEKIFHASKSLKNWPGLNHYVYKQRIEGFCVILIFGEIPHTFVVKIDDFYFYFPQVEKGRQNALETNELSLKIGTR